MTIKASPIDADRLRTGGVVHVLGGLDLDAEMVHHGRLAGLAFDEHQLQWRLRDGEVGVAGAALGRLDAEQRPVERDRGLQVRHPQRRYRLCEAVGTCLAAELDRCAPSS